MDQRTDQNESASNLGNSYYLKDQFSEMNAKFIGAMAAAIRAGLERPPRVGVDPRPGTKNPSFVRDSEVSRWLSLAG
jgi:hypothetical protein